MQTLTSKKLSNHLSEASAISMRQEIKERLASLEQEWRDLRKILDDEVDSSVLTEEPGSQFNLNNFRQVGEKEAGSGETAASLPLPDNNMDTAMSPREEEGSIEQLRKSYAETKTFERLARVEDQNRRLITYGSIIFTLMFGFMLYFMYLWKETHSLLGKSQIKVSNGISLHQPTEKGGPSLKGENQPPISATAKTPKTTEPPALTPKMPDQAAAGGNLDSTSASPEPKTPASPEQNLGLPAGQESSPVINTPQEKELPKVTYVGSITSNKYHYPDCKWAKTIIPRKVRVFHSVAEAQKAGYIRCPACQPPLTDEPHSPPADLTPAILPNER
jgi:hypothetical protein